jgi:hypothetical protein
MRQRVTLQFWITRPANEATVEILEGLSSLMRLMDGDGITDAERIRICILHECPSWLIGTRCQDVTADHRVLAGDTHQP